MRDTIIAAAKTLAMNGEYPRFFFFCGDLWECYRAEYLPDTGSRAWVAEKITPYKID